MKTVSLELSKQLKEAGYPQTFEHNFGYYSDEYHNKNGATSLEYSYGKEHTRIVNRGWNFICVSPTADEILDQLPNGSSPMVEDVRGIEIFKTYLGTYTIKLMHNNEIKQGMVAQKSLADGLAKMWLYLKKKGLL